MIKQNLILQSCLYINLAILNLNIILLIIYNLSIFILIYDSKSKRYNDYVDEIWTPNDSFLMAR